MSTPAKDIVSVHLNSTRMAGTGWVSDRWCGKPITKAAQQVIDARAGAIFAFQASLSTFLSVSRV